MTVHDYPSWCKDMNPSSISGLHSSAIKFIENLNLPTIHPTCTNQLPVAMAPQDDNIQPSIFSIVTLYWQIAPALLAMGELWLRLFAFLIAPLCICYLLNREFLSKNHISKKKDDFVSLFGLLSSAIILTDTLYVLELGQSYGLTLFMTMIILFFRSKSKPINIYQIVSYVTMGCTCLCLVSSYTSFGDFNVFRYLTHKELNMTSEHLWSHRHGHVIGNGTGLDMPTIQPGLYYSHNELTTNIVRHWPSSNRDYDTYSTPWCLTGDAKTGIPFLLNKGSILEGFRVWITPEETNAMDIFFPDDGIHRSDKPLYFVLHGLSGGSHEDYIQDFIQRRRKDGSTVIVLIARGMMKTPVVGWDVFHGARISDVHHAAKHIQSKISKDQLLVGVGYSMGGIILSNYVAQSGTKCSLDTAIAISGGLNMREQLTFYRSMRLWQPILAQELRNVIMNGFQNRYQTRLSPDDYLEFTRSSHISSIDRFAVVEYNGYEDLTHYYSEMSAYGDKDRISNVDIPFLVLHALDDPLISWRTLGNPTEIVKSGKGNILMLITKSGGHVGWPMGINPTIHAWKYMNDCVSDFVHSLELAIRPNRN